MRFALPGYVKIPCGCTVRHGYGKSCFPWGLEKAKAVCEKSIEPVVRKGITARLCGKIKRDFVFISFCCVMAGKGNVIVLKNEKRAC